MTPKGHQIERMAATGRVQVAEDGFVGEPADYDVTAYMARDSDSLKFQIVLDE